MKNKQEIRGISALAEISCSGILLLSMFLPWLSVRLGGSGTFGFSTEQSFSFFDGINKLSSIGGFASDLASTSNYAVLLYLIPLLCIVNIIIQCFTRLPWLSFYTAIIPTIVAIIIYYGCTKEAAALGSYGAFGGLTIGAGALLTILVGAIMTLFAWTSIGWYYKEHWIYLIVAVSWSLLSLCFPYKTFDLKYETTTTVIILCYVGRVHLPFVIYALLLCLISYCTGRRGEETEELHAEDSPVTPEIEEGYMNSVRLRSNENLKEILQNKEDYSDKLVNAAEKVLLERITSTPNPTSSSESLTPATDSVSEFDHENYKAYQPPSTNKQEEKKIPSTEQSVTERYEIPLSATEMQQASADSGEPADMEEYLTTDSSHRTRLTLIIAGITIVIIGALAYFLWYVPYTKERDTLHTYVIADSLLLRSSEESENEDNIIDKIYYGSELATYKKDSTWAKVKINGQEGFVASPYLLTSQEFSLLNNAWGNDKAKGCIESNKCRLAILDFFQTKQLASGPRGWQVYTRTKEEKPNAVFYPRIYNKNSKFSDFVFIVKNIQEGGKRILVCYSFDDETEAPIYRFCTEAPREGYIEKILPTSQGITIVFDNDTQIRISL